MSKSALTPGTMRTTGRTRLLVLAAASLFALAAAAQDASAPAQFEVKEASPLTGTLIRRNLVMSESLPLNKSYADLTPDQKKRVRSQYLGLRNHDEPPYPAHGILSIMTAILKAQQALAREDAPCDGALSLLVDVDAKGDAQSVSVLASPDPRMTRYVAAVLMDQKYKPAFCGGVPCPMQYPFRAAFHVGP
jgi:hypothetical protein